MRSSMFALLAGIAIVGSIAAQQPVPGPRPTKEIKPEDIKGEVTNAVALVKAGEVVPAGSRLEIEFDYTTDTPGKFAVAAEVFVEGWKGTHPVRGNAHPGFGHQPFTLSEKSGKGRVKVSYLAYGGKAPDLTAKEIKLFLWPISGARGRRDAATVKGPIRFEGSEIFTPRTKARLEAMEKELAQLRKTVERLEKLVEKGN